jgi:hypothetical protein
MESPPVPRRVNHGKGSAHNAACDILAGRALRGGYILSELDAVSSI